MVHDLYGFFNEIEFVVELDFLLGENDEHVSSVKNSFVAEVEQLCIDLTFFEDLPSVRPSSKTLFTFSILQGATMTPLVSIVSFDCSSCSLHVIPNLKDLLRSLVNNLQSGEL
ncbi:hypothetical protein Tco_0047687 [Tanacetum coccineum]